MGMPAAIGILLPLALAAAFSTIPLATVTVILLSRRAGPNGLAFLTGLTVGVFALTFGLSLGLSTLTPSTGPLRSVLLAVGEILLGVLLIGYGVVVFRREPRPRGRGGRWLAALDRAPAWSALTVGILMVVRPKALLLSVGAGVAIAKAELTTGETLIAVGVFTVVSVSTVAGPVIFMLIDPARATRWLMVAKGFVARHGRVFTLVVSIVVGVVLIGDGLLRLI